MGEVVGGVPISGGDDEPMEVDMRTKQRGGRCTRVSPRAPSISPSCTVGDGAGAGEVDADVEVEVSGIGMAAGDAIKDRAKEKGTTATILRVELVGAPSLTPYGPFSSFSRGQSCTGKREGGGRQARLASRGRAEASTRLAQRHNRRRQCGPTGVACWPADRVPWGPDMAMARRPGAMAQRRLA